MLATLIQNSIHLAHVIPPAVPLRRAGPHSPPPHAHMPKDLSPRRRWLQSRQIIEIRFSSGKIWNLGRADPWRLSQRLTHDQIAARCISRRGEFGTRSYKAYVPPMNEKPHNTPFSCTVRVAGGLFPMGSLPGGLHVRTVLFRFSVLGYSKNYLEERSHTAEQ